MKTRFLSMLFASAVVGAGSGWLASEVGNAHRITELDCVAANWVTHVTAITEANGERRNSESTIELLNSTLIALTLTLGANYEGLSAAPLNEKVRALAKRIVDNPGVLGEPKAPVLDKTVALAVLECIAASDSQDAAAISECSRQAISGTRLSSTVGG